MAKCSVCKQVVYKHAEKCPNCNAEFGGLLGPKTEWDQMDKHETTVKTILMAVVGGLGFLVLLFLAKCT